MKTNKDARNHMTQIQPPSLDERKEKIFGPTLKQLKEKIQKDRQDGYEVRWFEPAEGEEKGDRSKIKYVISRKWLTPQGVPQIKDEK